MIFLLPSDPLDIKKVDSSFYEEYNALIKMDFKVYLFDHDQFVSTDQLISNIDFSDRDDMILRSWMLNKDQYNRLFTILNRNGIKLINTTEQYLNCHYYPNVFKHIEKYAPKSIWLYDISQSNVEICRNYIDNDIIIKDFVKSEKGSDDIFILPKTLTNDEFYERVLKFKTSRGKLFNEGIVFKEYCNLRKYGDKTNEYRIFVLNGKMIAISNNTDLGYGQVPNCEFLNGIIPLIESNYFTIDIAERESGEWMILECGDGQVSGLSPNQDEFIYYSNFLEKTIS